MQYRCIRDFYMESPFQKKPAFSVGKVYQFRRVDDLPDCLVTDNNDQNRKHYMPIEDINDYFELV